MDESKLVAGHIQVSTTRQQGKLDLEADAGPNLHNLMLSPIMLQECAEHVTRLNFFNC